jgi:hypothetical protein
MARTAILLLLGLGVRADEYDPVIDPTNFVETIDNPYLPLIPGTTFVYEGDTEDGLVHEEVSVTKKTKEILGVTCTVVRHREWEDDELVEDTLDWFAQDAQGNVWYFGEFVTHYEDGREAGHAGSWEAGVDGAKPGIIMLADPQPGNRYRQEFYEGVAEDMAAVLRLNEPVSVEGGDFDDCLVTKEWTPLEPGHVEKKYYAAGTGLVLIEEQHGVRIELIEVLD